MSPITRRMAAATGSSPPPHPPPPPPQAGDPLRVPLCRPRAWPAAASRALSLALAWVRLLGDVFLQRLFLARLGPPDAVGGPAAGRTFIVTGPTSGIGRETAAALARRGARLVLGCRDAVRGEALRRELEGGPVLPGAPRPTVEVGWVAPPPWRAPERALPRASLSRRARPCDRSIALTRRPAAQVLPLDLSSLASVRAFASGWAARDPPHGPPLHCLVNNAGLFAMSGPRSQTRDGLESHLGTNFASPALLTLLLVPALARAGASGPPGRAVFVASFLHELGEIRLEDPNLAGKGAYSPLAAYAQASLRAGSLALARPCRARACFVCWFVCLGGRGSRQQ